MENLDLAALAATLPLELQGKICPRLGTVDIPQPNPLNPNELNISMMPKPCVGHHCAMWEQCQGKDSLAALRGFLETTRLHAKVIWDSKVYPLLSKLAESRLFKGLF